MKLTSRNGWAVLAATVAAHTNSLVDVKNIVLFMQENRSFDHYFGTMAGVRGFGDPNAQVNDDGFSVFEQQMPDAQNGTHTLKPWYINYLGGEWKEATQCMYGGDNGWDSMHTAYNGGLGNKWLQAEAWSSNSTAGGYAMGSPTNPNGEGSMIIDDNYMPDAGISWQVWQDFDNFEDNMVAYFKQYQEAKNGSALQEKGNSYPGLEAFRSAAKSGTLPQVSFIVGPQELAEHAPNMPIDGAWLQKQLVDTITSSPAYNKTVLIISYDEQGGWMDHVVPMAPPKGTPGKWIDIEPLGGATPVGPGWRIPRYIISPWTRGGNVFAEPSDHTSDIMFVEAWAEANGYSLEVSTITPWRRSHMSNLVNAFNFREADYTAPPIASVRKPEADPDKPWEGTPSLGSLQGPWVGPAKCEQMHSGNQPPIPYGEQNAGPDMASLVEDGFKVVRGLLTEGRYVVFEQRARALTAKKDATVGISEGTEKHEKIEQRWILHSLADYGKQFYVQSAKNKQYISAGGKMSKSKSEATPISIDYDSSRVAYTLSVSGSKRGVNDWTSSSIYWKAYSVSYTQ
ncbi:hypothetical protein NLG97_g2907 [Lecanicillium saksenae]|uniref:Uncharacterized protein n=1 Tax=Lecanicillium saksenae TaxID=468837 RepID=A0ACC1R1G0_9HYPO|nr:hypothetical protein NLG97_g2907 [Lecanicillium saksenae]